VSYSRKEQVSATKSEEISETLQRRADKTRQRENSKCFLTCTRSSAGPADRPISGIEEGRPAPGGSIPGMGMGIFRRALRLPTVDCTPPGEWASTEVDRALLNGPLVIGPGTDGDIDAGLGSEPAGDDARDELAAGMTKDTDPLGVVVVSSTVPATAAAAGDMGTECAGVGEEITGDVTGFGLGGVGSVEEGEPIGGF